MIHNATLETAIEKIKSQTEIWSQVLMEEKSIQDNEERLSKIDNNEREKLIYEMESRPAGMTRKISHDMILALEEDTRKITSISDVIMAIRYHARRELGFSV